MAMTDPGPDHNHDILFCFVDFGIFGISDLGSWFSRVLVLGPGTWLRVKGPAGRDVGQCHFNQTNYLRPWSAGNGMASWH